MTCAICTCDQNLKNINMYYTLLFCVGPKGCKGEGGIPGIDGMPGRRGDPGGPKGDKGDRGISGTQVHSLCYIMIIM